MSRSRPTPVPRPWLFGAAVYSVLAPARPAGPDTFRTQVYAAVGKPVSPADPHATVLHAFGIGRHDLGSTPNNRKDLHTATGGAVVRECFA